MVRDQVKGESKIGLLLRWLGCGLPPLTSSFLSSSALISAGWSVRAPVIISGSLRKKSKEGTISTLRHRSSIINYLLFRDLTLLGKGVACRTSFEVLIRPWVTSRATVSVASLSFSADVEHLKLHSMHLIWLIGSWFSLFLMQSLWILCLHKNR